MSARPTTPAAAAMSIFDSQQQSQRPQTPSTSRKPSFASPSRTGGPNQYKCVAPFQPLFEKVATAMNDLHGFFRALPSWDAVAPTHSMHVRHLFQMARSCLDEAESLFLSNLSMLPSTNQSVPGWSQLHLQGWLADEAALIHMQHASHRSYLVEFLTGIAPLGVNDSFVPTSAPASVSLIGPAGCPSDSAWHALSLEWLNLKHNERHQQLDYNLSEAVNYVVQKSRNSTRGGVELDLSIDSASLRLVPLLSRVFSHLQSLLLLPEHGNGVFNTNTSQHDLIQQPKRRLSDDIHAAPYESLVTSSFSLPHALAALHLVWESNIWTPVISMLRQQQNDLQVSLNQTDDLGESIELSGILTLCDPCLTEHNQSNSSLIGSLARIQQHQRLLHSLISAVAIKTTPVDQRTPSSTPPSTPPMSPHRSARPSFSERYVGSSMDLQTPTSAPTAVLVQAPSRVLLANVLKKFAADFGHCSKELHAAVNSACASKLPVLCDMEPIKEAAKICVERALLCSQLSKATDPLSAITATVSEKSDKKSDKKSDIESSGGRTRSRSSSLSFHNIPTLFGMSNQVNPALLQMYRHGNEVENWVLRRKCMWLQHCTPTKFGLSPSFLESLQWASTHLNSKNSNCFAVLAPSSNVIGARTWFSPLTDTLAQLQSFGLPHQQLSALVAACQRVCNWLDRVQREHVQYKAAQEQRRAAKHDSPHSFKPESFASPPAHSRASVRASDSPIRRRLHNMSTSMTSSPGAHSSSMLLSPPHLPGNVPASPSAAELASSYFSSFLQPFSNSSTIVPDAIDASAPFGVSLSSQIACDDLICIVALALVQAAPTHFISDIQMLQDLCDQRTLMGEQGYILTTLWCAVDFLLHLDLGDELLRPNELLSKNALCALAAKQESHSSFGPVRPQQWRVGVEKPADQSLSTHTLTAIDLFSIGSATVPALQWQQCTFCCSVSDIQNIELDVSKALAVAASSSLTSALLKGDVPESESTISSPQWCVCRLLSYSTAVRYRNFNQCSLDKQLHSSPLPVRSKPTHASSPSSPSAHPNLSFASDSADLHASNAAVAPLSIAFQPLLNDALSVRPLAPNAFQSLSADRLRAIASLLPAIDRMITDFMRAASPSYDPIDGWSRVRSNLYRQDLQVHRRTVSLPSVVCLRSQTIARQTSLSTVFAKLSDPQARGTWDQSMNLHASVDPLLDLQTDESSTPDMFVASHVRAEIIERIDASTMVIAFRFQFTLHRRLLHREFLVLWHTRIVDSTHHTDQNNTNANGKSLLIVARSISHASCPVSPWQPRGRLFVGGWLLTPVGAIAEQHGNSCGTVAEQLDIQITNVMHCDIGDTSLPSWVLQAAIAQYPLMLDRLLANL